MGDDFIATKENTKSGVNVSGGDKADVLSNYGDNNVSNNAGEGNDMHYGEADNVFVYKPNEGTDTITDYYYSNYSCDMLQILKTDGLEGGT